MFIDLIISNLANVTCSDVSFQYTDFSVMMLSSSRFISVIDGDAGGQHAKWNINGVQDSTNISIEALQDWALYADLYIHNINKLNFICKS
jgi:hypothetical protein